MDKFAVIYGKQDARSALTPAITDISWSSQRGEIARSMTVRLRDIPTVSVAGMLMCFSHRIGKALLHHKNQFFHGPIIDYEQDEFTRAWEIKAREIGWYLAKNKGVRPYLKGEAGAELQKYIQTTGVDFRCPKLGFNLDERYGTMAHSEIILDVLQKHMSVAATGIMWMLSGRKQIFTCRSFVKGQTSGYPFLFPSKWKPAAQDTTWKTLTPLSQPRSTRMTNYQHLSLKLMLAH